MATPPAARPDRTTLLGLGPQGLVPNLYDVIIFILMAGVFVLLAHGAREMGAPLGELDIEPVTLDPANLPEYALRTTLRMFAAIVVSLVFTFARATKGRLIDVLVNTLHLTWRCPPTAPLPSIDALCCALYPAA